MCKSLIGKKLAGSIEKVPCEPYEFQRETGETVTLNYRYQYSQKEDTTVKQELNPVEVQQQNHIPILPLTGQMVIAAA